MKKKISFTTQGQRADIGEYIIKRILPNRYTEIIGPFVFLDHLLPVKHSPGETFKTIDRDGAHPHRGIATLTYILNGEAEHLDSKGNHAIVRSGGAQWMNAGNGIIHAEVVNSDSQTNDLLTHALQFWINLPSKQKRESPIYLSIDASEVPKQILSDNRGWLKLIAGEYEDMVSKIPSYSKQFLYHFHLEPGKKVSPTIENGLEYAMFLPLHDAVINDIQFNNGDFIVFDKEEGTIEIINNSGAAIDIIVFGGEKYAEAIVAKGPFVMNSELEISQAYNDFNTGKYGTIDFNKQTLK